MRNDPMNMWILCADIRRGIRNHYPMPQSFLSFDLYQNESETLVYTKGRKIDNYRCHRYTQVAPHNPNTSYYPILYLGIIVGYTILYLGMIYYPYAIISV